MHLKSEVRTLECFLVGGTDLLFTRSLRENLPSRTGVSAGFVARTPVV